MPVPAGPFLLDDSYARAVPELSLRWDAAPAPEPRLLTLDEGLAAELGVDPDALRTPAGIRLLLGDVSGLDPQPPTFAQAYAGHQFGGYSPRLGDGRALLLGEVTDTAGQTRDLHLKGSGRTPFARGGDGRAAVGPMLREHVMGVAMHALGIPTTRAFAVIATGEPVLRQEGSLPGAVLVRVAASHLRVGTVQYASALAAQTGDLSVLRRLVDHALQRHHPEAAGSERPALALLEAVTAAQARLIALWSGAGLVHGVMNTDNMTLSGETIDYGPCAMLDAHDPAAVFSSIDSGGRYAYGNQPAMAQWNLARLAEALLPLIAEGAGTDVTAWPTLDETQLGPAVEAATAVLEGFAGQYEAEAAEVFSRKIGLAAPDAALVGELLSLMAEARVDHTGFFRALGEGDEAARRAVIEAPAGDEQVVVRLDAWMTRRRAALAASGRSVAEASAAMAQVNPVYSARNHVVEEALTAATAGDLALVERLLAALADPFTERPGLDDLASPAPSGLPRHVTFCGT